MIVGQTESFTIGGIVPGDTVTPTNNAPSVGTATVAPDGTGQFHALGAGSCNVTFSAPHSTPVVHAYTVSNPAPLTYTTNSVS